MYICKKCVYFTFDYIEQNGEEKSFQCRRYAPRIIMGSGTGWSGQLFPKVKETDWCGEFESE